MTPSGRRDFADLERVAHALAVKAQDEPGFVLADFIRAKVPQSTLQVGTWDYRRIRAYTGPEGE